MTARRQNITVPRPTSFERNSPYARRIAQKSEINLARPVPPPRLWASQDRNRSVSPPLTSLAEVNPHTPRLSPKHRPVPTDTKKSSHNMHSLDAHMQNRLQKLSSKRDRQKQAKEDDYALDPSLVQVIPQHACARCKSQKWKCYILGDGTSPRRTCLPCGKNKCTFGGSKHRPPTLPLTQSSMDDVMAVQRPRLIHNPGYEHSHHAHSHAAPLSSNGFSHHRSNSGHMHQHPPPLHLRHIGTPFPTTSLTTPELSPSSLTDAFPSPDPRTPLDGYFFRPEERDHMRDLDIDPRLSFSSSRGADHESDNSDMGVEFELDDLERPSSPRSGDYDPISPWAAQSVIHLIPSERLRPIPLPSPAEILSREPSPGPSSATPSAADSPVRLTSPAGSPLTSPRRHAHAAAPIHRPSSPHCPPSPLFPPSPKVASTHHRHSLPSLTLPPLRSTTLPVLIPRSNSMSVSSLSLSPLPSLGSSPSISPSSSFEPPPPTHALLSLLIESATRAPNDPRPLMIANDMLGVSDQWVSQINAARRAGESRLNKGPDRRELDFDGYTMAYRPNTNGEYRQ